MKVIPRKTSSEFPAVDKLEVLSSYLKNMTCFTAQGILDFTVTFGCFPQSTKTVTLSANWVCIGTHKDDSGQIVVPSGWITKLCFEHFIETSFF